MPSVSATRAPTRSAISRRDRQAAALPQSGCARARRMPPRRRAGRVPQGLDAAVPLKGQWGYRRRSVERQGHAVRPLGDRRRAGDFRLGLFPARPSRPSRARLTDALIARAASLPGLLGNKHASGTEIIAELGEEHMRTGKPIIYTSADSVIQIAAHEETFRPRPRSTRSARSRASCRCLSISAASSRGPSSAPIARDFTRTGNRKDYSMPPPAPTLLDQLTEAGRAGHLASARSATSMRHSGTGQRDQGGRQRRRCSMRRSPRWLRSREAGCSSPISSISTCSTAIAAMSQGYAASARSLRCAPAAGAWRSSSAGDLLIITADHGCDPTWRGSDHTRECVPILCWSPGLAPGSIGRRESFADIGQTIAQHLGISSPLQSGTGWS